MRHKEIHRSQRIGWLRAAVLGANDGIVSTASLILGVAAADTSSSAVATAGIAGLVAGAMSMAAGEYVSVRSQADTEEAELAQERRELATDGRGEHAELERIYVGRGLTPELAREVASQLMAKDALGAHARDELGIVESQRARPLLASIASAASFAVGALLPLMVAILVPRTSLPVVVVATSLVCLAAVGAIAAQIGGAPALPGAVRVTVWGAAAMALTYGAGAAVGTIV
ncbi:MAG TPA: VIT family protein [Kofleriaceae bacterium]|jgi:VIT1/CCC1 family predicted Fe2+/Mn2+ transporter